MVYTSGSGSTSENALEFLSFFDLPLVDRLMEWAAWNFSSRIHHQKWKQNGKANDEGLHPGMFGLCHGLRILCECLPSRRGGKDDGRLYSAGFGLCRFMYDDGQIALKRIQAWDAHVGRVHRDL